MPHRQQHRGPHPEDRRLFSESRIEVLARGAEEAAYLLGRGYSTTSVLDVVGRRHQLEARQRLALGRAMCSDLARRERRSRSVPLEAARGRVLQIDGFNLIIGLEVALSGGLLLRGADGAIRDLAGLRGSYRTVEETGPALVLLGELVAALAPRAVRFWLDRPVSNSGRLRALILEHAARFGAPVEVELVPNPDVVLYDQELVVSSDALVLDRVRSWVNLLEHALATRVPGAWLVDLGERDTTA